MNFNRPRIIPKPIPSESVRPNPKRMEPGAKNPLVYPVYHDGWFLGMECHSNRPKRSLAKLLPLLFALLLIACGPSCRWEYRGEYMDTPIYAKERKSQ